MYSLQWQSFLLGTVLKLCPFFFDFEQRQTFLHMAFYVLNTQRIERLSNTALRVEVHTTSQGIQLCPLVMVLDDREATFDRVVLWRIGNVVNCTHIRAFLLSGV